MQKSIEKSSKSYSLRYVFILVIILSNISQIPYFIENGIGRYLSITGWTILFIYILLNRMASFDKKLIFFIVLIYLYIIFLLFSELVKQGGYLSSSFIYPFFLSMFIFIVSFCSAKRIEEMDLKAIINTYIFTSIIVSISVYIKSFYGNFNWSGVEYNYGSKNSVSQIIFTAFILLVVVLKPQNKIGKLLKWLISTFFLLLLLMLRSRASILGLPIMVLIILYFGKKMNKKYIYILIIVVFFIMLMLNESFFNFIVNNILFGNRDVSDLNSITSDRLLHYTRFPYLFVENPLLGRGDYWLESFPLTVLVQYGILGSIPILTIAFYPLFWALTRMRKKSDISISFIILVSVYSFNSFFESLAPYGPGVKNYMLWLMFGLLFGWHNKKIN